MAIFDYSLLLSNRQAITASAVSQNATEPTVYDQGPIGTAHGHAARLRVNLGSGACIPLLVQVVEDFAAAGAATLEVQLQTSEDEAFATPADIVTVVSSGPIPVDKLKAGFRLTPTEFIPDGVGFEGVTKRYMRLNYVVAAGPFTAGQVVAGVVYGTQTNPLTV